MTISEEHDVLRRALETLSNTGAFGPGRIFSTHEDVISFATHTLKALTPRTVAHMTDTSPIAPD